MPRARECEAAAAPAVAGDDDVLAGPEDVRGARDAIERALAGAVAVVEHVLRVRLVDGDDGVLEAVLAGEGAQADDAGRRLLGAADDAASRSVRSRWRRATRSAPSSIVIWASSRARHRRDVVGVVVLALDGEGGDAVLGDERGGDVVLRAERFEAQSAISAPPSRRAIIKLAVSVVTWRHAATRRPLSGRSFASARRSGG